MNYVGNKAALYLRVFRYSLLGITWLAGAHSFGCGLKFTPVGTQFDGVDYRGYVFLVETLGKIQLAEDSSATLTATFGSKREFSSPFLGYGWSIPFLESKIVQSDERTFDLYQPDGRFRQFWRDPKNPSLLNGQGGWKAEIRGDSITVWSDCGARMAYRQGRISSMQVSGRTLDYVYNGDSLVEIRDNVTPIVTVLRDPKNVSVTGLRLADGKEVHFETAARPRIQVVNNQNIVGQVVPSASKIVTADGEVKEIIFDVDPALNPIMKIGTRTILWDPLTKKIRKDGDWEYQITGAEQPGAYAAITRTQGGLREYWFNDTTKGIETLILKDGFKRETRRFSSGPLAGKLRSVTEYLPGKSTPDVYKLIYNEKGQVVSEETPGSTLYFHGYRADMKLAEVADVHTVSSGGGQRTVEASVGNKGRLQITLGPGNRLISYKKPNTTTNEIK